MNVSNFISPLETVQVLSIFTYVNTLSDILFAEDYLSEEDQRKHIPIVNSLYHYLLDEFPKEEIDKRKTQLVRKLINGSDLYGSKDSENLDLNFVNTLLNHIVSTLVFENFSNVYGFIAQTVRESKTDSLKSLLKNLEKALLELEFENELGEYSELDFLAVENIFCDIIEPLFPEARSSLSVTSIDYIYAQAGRMFLRSGQSVEVNTNDHKTKRKAETKEKSETKQKAETDFQELIETGIVVEHLVLSKKLNESVLSIFALPALINYMYKTDHQLEKSADIVNSETHWKKAYKCLFSRLNDSFSEIENVQADDYRYQFYLAFSSLKNRTSLARELIKIHCCNGSPVHLSEEEMEEETTNYKNNPDSYRCRNGEKILVDLNKSFYNLINNITQKYYTYEKESMREAFGDDFISLMNSEEVIISRGLVHFEYSGIINLPPTSKNLIKPSDDLFQLYYPDNDTYLYYALTRKDYTITLIKESDDPVLFRQKLGLTTYENFRTDFPTDVKKDNENFQDFLDRIAKLRSEQFSANLKATNYDQTRTEWWEDFGLSLIPFYSCAEGIREKNLQESVISCSLDVLFFIPVIGEVGSLVGKMSTAATKTIIALSETTLRTVTLRTSIRSALNIGSKIVIKELAQFVALFELNTFRNLGVSLLRFLDPGFELMFKIGNGGLKVIKNFISHMGRKHLISFASLKSVLQGSETLLANFRRNIGKLALSNGQGKKFLAKDAFVTGLAKDSGYGYRYIPLKDGQLAEIRTIRSTREEIPVVGRISEDGVKVFQEVDTDSEKVFQKMDTDNGGVLQKLDTDNEVFQELDTDGEKIFGDELFVEEDGFLVSEEETFEMTINHQEWDGMVEGKNPLQSILWSTKNRDTAKKALEFAISKGKIPETELRKELMKYAFSGSEKTEINFVKDWLHELKIPSWAQEYRIKEPELFYELKYLSAMERSGLTFKEAMERIRSLEYPVKVKEELPVDKVLQDFKERKGYNQATFEDYYALRYYGGSGYKKMAENSDVARRMKNAIYRLAIRQSEDPSEECVKTLFRGEGRVTEAIEKEFYEGRKEFEIQRFSSVSTDIAIADRYSKTDNSMFTKVVYELKFENPYIRSRVEHLFVLEEKETILLPGTKFRIDKVTKGVTEESFGTQKFMKVELTHIEEPKFVLQQRIMKAIKNLKDTATKFYAGKAWHEI